MKQKLFYTTLVLLLFGVLLAELHFTPTMQSWKNGVRIFVFGITFFVGIIYLRQLWQHQENGISKMVRTIILIISFSVAFFFAMPDIFEPEYIKTIHQDNNTYYIYYESCFPPDGACECDYYGSLIYVENNYFPIVHLIAKTNFYVEDILIEGNKLMAIPSDECLKDSAKALKVNL